MTIEDMAKLSRLRYLAKKKRLTSISILAACRQIKPRLKNVTDEGIKDVDQLLTKERLKRESN
jgi:hypothetical protein